VTGQGMHAQVDRTLDWWLFYLLIIVCYFSFISQKVINDHSILIVVSFCLV